eukprot:365775-Chlamydomonas_euryale.AAC.10
MFVGAFKHQYLCPTRLGNRRRLCCLPRRPPPFFLPDFFLSTSSFFPTRRNFKGYEEVYVPPAPSLPPPAADELVAIASLPQWAQPAFAGYKALNRIQSKIFPSAFGSNENLLVCAPTGAGKTNIAMIAVLREVRPVPAHTCKAARPRSQGSAPELEKPSFRFLAYDTVSLDACSPTTHASMLTSHPAPCR